MARPLHHPALPDITIDNLLHALADPVRRNILARLQAGAGMNCNSACAELPASTISFHYRVLREAGLIRSEKRGVEVINTSRAAEIEQRFPGLLQAVFFTQKQEPRS